MSYAPEGCTHNCHTCGAACGSDKKPKPGFSDHLEAFNEQFDDYTDEELLKMIQDFSDKLGE